MPDDGLETARERLKDVTGRSRDLVFFGGAGVSTESGIPDFRSADGIFVQEFRYRPEEVVSRSFFDRRPDVFFEFFRSKVVHPGARPNPAHLKLAELEREGRLKATITQNIDGLHQMAGARKVIELHGSIMRERCTRCGKGFTLEYVLDERNFDGQGVPRCDACAGVVRPDVVMFEEPLFADAISSALAAIRSADTLIVAGTSLVVYPAAGLVGEFGGRDLVIINKSGTPADKAATLLINAPVGAVFDYV
jgi:NAD-dependent deacetylase